MKSSEYYLLANKDYYIRKISDYFKEALPLLSKEEIIMRSKVTLNLHLNGDLIYIVIQNQSPIKMKTEVVCLFVNRYVYIQSSLFRRGC